MIASSRFLKMGAFFAAATVHVAAFNGFSPDMRVEIESNLGASEAISGSSFADMVSGTMTAADAEEMVDPVENLDETPPTEVRDTLPNSPKSVLQPVQASAQPPLASSEPILVAATLVVDAIAIVPQVTKPLEPEHVRAPSVPIEVLTASENVADTPPSKSPRPTKRKPQPKTEKITKKKKKPKKIAKPKATPRGNAKNNNLQGSTTGVKTARAKVKGVSKGKAGKKSGNAAASNYPGKVMRKIARVPRPRGHSKGTAVVAFSVSSSGGLARVSLARSSGSSALDKAALRVIRKAAPFPAPPSGARRSFSIRIKGR